MKKLLTIGALVICFTMPSATTFASTENPKVGVELQSAPNYWTGRIKANNGNIRNNNGTSLGEVNKGDTFKIDMTLSSKTFNGVVYPKVTMTSGNNKGTTGWIPADYIDFNL